MQKKTKSLQRQHPMETQSSMANVPREFPLTPRLPCSVCERCCEPISSHPDWKGAQRSRFPWEFTSIQYLGHTGGNPATPPQQRRKARARTRPGRGHALISIHHSIHHPDNTPSHQRRKHLLSCWKASAHQSGSPKHKQICVQICHFLWDSLTGRSCYKSGPGK